MLTKIPKIHDSIVVLIMFFLIYLIVQDVIIILMFRAILIANSLKLS